MKKINNYILIFTSLFIIYGCTGDFEDMNKSPNGLDQIDDPSYYLPRMQQRAIAAFYTEYQQGVSLYANQYCQYFANTSTGFDTDRYSYNDGWSNAGYWHPYYMYVLKYMREIKSIYENDRPDYEEMYHIARIMNAVGTARMTDMFGDIPYSEGAAGIDKPKYDSQKDIYYDILNELKEAVNALNAENYSVDQKKYGDQDLVYNGDAKKWLRLGNSLRLRYAMRLAFVDPEKAKVEVEDALTKPLMTQVSDIAAYKTGVTSDAQQHPVTVICFWNEFRLSKTLADAYLTLSSVQDPRLECYWGYTKESTEEGETPIFDGLRNGLPVTELSNVVDKASNTWGLKWYPEWNTSLSTPSGWVDAPYYFMCYSEVCFLKAEAAIRGWSGAGDAQTNYIDGIIASIEEARLDVDPSDYSTDNDELYYTTGEVAWNNADDFETKLKKIITQKWISLFPNGNEAWAECRRTGYPELIPVAQSDDPSINPNNGEFIKKLRYLEIERRDNPENSTASTLNNGQGDGASVRVWWDTGRYK